MVSAALLILYCYSYYTKKLLLENQMSCRLQHLGSSIKKGERVKKSIKSKSLHSIVIKNENVKRQLATVYGCH